MAAAKHNEDIKTETIIIEIPVNDHASVSCIGINDLTLGCQTSNSESSPIFHHLPLLTLLVALVLH